MQFRSMLLYKIGVNKLEDRRLHAFVYGTLLFCFILSSYLCMVPYYSVLY
jgi:hypothetical protein